MNRVSLELAKQLKDAGFPQDKAEKHHYGGNIGEAINKKESIIEHVTKNKWAIPSADEILDELPAMIVFNYEDEDTEYYLVIEKYPHSNHYELIYVTDGEHSSIYDNGDCRQTGKTVADAAAKMWLYLKENDLL